MKQFFLWAGLVVLLYAGLGAGAYFVQGASSVKILVAIDVSGSLETSKHNLEAALAFLTNNRYAQFKIVTNSPSNEYRVIQEYSPTLDLAKVKQIKMYTALDLEKLLAFDEIKSADEIVFVTNAVDTVTLQNVSRSRIVRVP